MIPVFEPFVDDDDLAAIVAAFKRGEISGSFGSAIPDFERAFADYCGVKHGVAVTSGTTALQLAVAAAGIGEGDEVLVSACTNIATALAVIHNGALPVPIDSEPTTWNLDLELVERAITPRTKAIIPVHLYGHPVDMDALSAIAKRRGLMVIEDCAESHGATVRGRMTGSFGEMGCFSFYANKVITTGEGGMVVTNDDALADKLRLLRNLGFRKPRFRHDVAAFNFRMTGLQAAMGTTQTRKIEAVIAQKRRVAHAYNRLLGDLDWLQLPPELEWARNVYWMYAIVVRENARVSRDVLAQRLESDGIETRTFFCPMSDQPCVTGLRGYRPVATPVADRLWQAGLYLPSAPTLSEEQLKLVAQCVARAGTVA